MPPEGDFECVCKDIGCIAPIQGFPHPGPLPEGEGIVYFYIIFPMAYNLGYTQAAP